MIHVNFIVIAVTLSEKKSEALLSAPSHVTVVSA
jgi:hypothetical protein